MKVEPAPSPPIAAAVAEIERRLRPAAVLLFGSAATARATRLSDVDFAILLARRAAEEIVEINAVVGDIEALVGRAVDLVVLDHASPVVAMQVLGSGRLLSCCDPEALERFTVRTLTDYADLKITRRTIEERLLRPRET